MAEAGTNPLQGRRILIVEDEYAVAADLAQSLEDRGAVVAGPVGSVREALALIAHETALDFAVLDINLGQEKAYPIAEALRSQGVPLVFATGYDAWIIPPEHADVPRLEKPIDLAALARAISNSGKGPGPGTQ